MRSVAGSSARAESLTEPDALARAEPLTESDALANAGRGWGLLRTLCTCGMELLHMYMCPCLADLVYEHEATMPEADCLALHPDVRFECRDGPYWRGAHPISPYWGCPPTSPRCPAPPPPPPAPPAPPPPPPGTITGGGDVSWHCEGNDWCAQMKGVSAQHCNFWVPDSVQIPSTAQVRFFVNGANYRTTSLSCGWITDCRDNGAGVRGCTYKVYWEGCGRHECHGDEIRYSGSDQKWCDLYIDGRLAIAGHHGGVHFNQGCG